MDLKEKVLTKQEILEGIKVNEAITPQNIERFIQGMELYKKIYNSMELLVDDIIEQNSDVDAIVKLINEVILITNKYIDTLKKSYISKEAMKIYVENIIDKRINDDNGKMIIAKEVLKKL